MAARANLLGICGLKTVAVEKTSTIESSKTDYIRKWNKQVKGIYYMKVKELNMNTHSPPDN